MYNETELILDRLMNPLDDAIKDVARAIRNQCPDSLRLCKLIEDNYAKVLRNGGYAGGFLACEVGHETTRKATCYCRK